MCPQTDDNEGRAMMLVAAAIAAGLAEGRSVEDITVMAALLDVIADQLALLAAVRARKSVLDNAYPQDMIH